MSKDWTEKTAEEKAELIKKNPGSPWEKSISFKRGPDARGHLVEFRISEGQNFGTRVFHAGITRTIPNAKAPDPSVIYDGLMLKESEAAELERWLKAMHPNPNKE